MSKPLQLSEARLAKALRLHRQAMLKADRRGERADRSAQEVAMTWRSGRHLIRTSVSFFHAGYYQTVRVRADGKLVFSADVQGERSVIRTWRPGAWERWLLRNPIVPEQEPCA